MTLPLARLLSESVWMCFILFSLPSICVRKWRLIDRIGAVREPELPHCAGPHGEQEPVIVLCTPVQSPPRCAAPRNGGTPP